MRVLTVMGGEVRPRLRLGDADVDADSFKAISLAGSVRYGIRTKNIAFLLARV
jgi:hypothetical protein